MRTLKNYCTQLLQATEGQKIAQEKIRSYEQGNITYCKIIKEISPNEMSLLITVTSQS